MKRLKEFITTHPALLIIAVLFLIRLAGILHPPLEPGHSWRQVTGLMVARNFAETGDWFYPRIDDTAGGTGIIGMEFPFLNYLIAITAKAFGFQHWYGRAWVLIISSIGSWFFYRLINKFFGEPHALFSLILFGCGMWFAFGRKTMPDAVALSLALAALWFGIKYIEQGGVKNFILYSLLGVLGVSTKLPAVVIMGVMGLYVPLWKSSRVQHILLGGILMSMAAMGWYWGWNVHLEKTYGYWYNLGVSPVEGVKELIKNLPVVFERLFITSLHSYIALLPLLIGVAAMFLHKQKLLQRVCLASCLLILLYLFKSGWLFIHHSYYSLPVLPILALLAGNGVAMLWLWKWGLAIVLILLAGLEGILNQVHDLRYNTKKDYLLKLEQAVDAKIPGKSLIIVNGGADPGMIYFSHRKGWTMDTKIIAGQVDSLKMRGAEYVVLDRHLITEEIFTLPVVYSDNHFLILEL